MTFGGAVLCGGASRRMGRDKALLEVDGVAMAARVAHVLVAAGAEPVIAVGGAATELAGLGLEVVPDDRPGEGPLTATLTALQHLSMPVVAVLGCDLVAPSEATVRTMVGALAAAAPPILGALPVVDGVRQWTHAAWRLGALAPLQAAADAGRRSLRAAGAGVAVLELHDLDPRHLADADRPEELPWHGGGPGRAG
jgi:molybdenum cofactor guanylyltransferase